MLRFGTDGIRGVANVELTPETAFRIGRFLGSYQGIPRRIIVGEDTRISSPLLSSSLESGLLSSGGTVSMLGVVPTALVSFALLNDRRIDYGIMISASHNPFPDNGIKILSSGGEKLSSELEREIEAFLSSQDNLPRPSGSSIGTLKDGGECIDGFVNYLKGIFRHEGRPVDVLVDCANGSASAYAHDVFSAWGLNPTLINHSPNGTNINENCGSTHIKALLGEKKNESHDLAFAFDGDADRVLALDREGHLIDGDAQLFMKALILKEKGLLTGNKVVITPMSNLGLLEALGREGISTIEVGVGDRHIQAALIAGGYLVGAEPSGHVIHMDMLPTGDGMLSSSQILDCYLNHPEIYRKAVSYFRYPHYLHNVRFPNREVAEKALGNESFKSLSARLEKRLQGHGRLFLRSSGTEPLLRIYVECDKESEAKSIALELASVFGEVR